MYPRSGDYSEFGTFLIALCDRAERSVYDIALEAGIRTRSRMNAALRKRWFFKGPTALLSSEELQNLAKVLLLTEDERERLILLGLKEYMPPMLRDYYDRIERDHVNRRVHDQKAPSRIRLRQRADTEG